MRGKRRQHTGLHSGALCLLGLAATACGSTAGLVEDLDPVTGVTTTRSSVPFVLYRDNSGQAAYARDYVYMGPISVNRMGSYRYYIWLGVWSTMRAQAGSDQRDGFETITVFVDGEPLSLDLHGWTADAIGLSVSPYPAPVASAADAFYEVTIDQIRLIGEAREVRIYAGVAAPATYEPWDSQAMAQAGWRRFVEEIGY
ncbi:MAG: hypothetical protein OEW35_06335 [Gammaproteobacteria bacterium]|nr:hypothetical protein [Gammaproteobacteria bacterium]MDH4253392.1 hypothetical protein [Gammaproteobacteria bacterium]MDH5310297.1 hypothetical protein [Gammaproteobacteria bacterium]